MMTLKSTTGIRNAPVPFFIKPITRSVAARVDAAYLDQNVKLQFGFLEQQLASSPQNGEFFAGAALSGADIMMILPLEAAVKRAGVTKEKYPKITAYIERIQLRPAYQRAIKKIEDVTGEEFKSVT
jgi:glutathione S-transferase